MYVQYALMPLHPKGFAPEEVEEENWGTGRFRFRV